MSDRYFLIIGNSRFAYEFIDYCSERQYCKTHIQSIHDSLRNITLSNDYEYYVIWAGGTSDSSILNLGEYVIKFQESFLFFKKSTIKFKHIYLSSAGQIYPNSTTYVNEDVQILPLTMYAYNKLEEEECIRSLVHKGDTYLIFRLANVYGSRIKSGNTGLITIIDKKILGEIEKIITISSSPESRRQYGWYQDYVSNMFKIMDATLNWNLIINLAPQFSYSILDIIQIYGESGQDLIEAGFVQLSASKELKLDTLLVTSKYDFAGLKLNWNTLKDWLAKPPNTNNYFL